MSESMEHKARKLVNGFGGGTYTAWDGVEGVFVAFASLGGWISDYPMSFTLSFVDQVEGCK